MSKNPGKMFEEDFKNSVPDNWFCYRLKDSSGSWSNTGNSRFTPSNMCDFFILNTELPILYGVECKSFKGKSMPYGNLNDKKNSKLKKLCEMSRKKYCWGIFIFNFRDHSKTFAITAITLKEIIKNTKRKSLSLKEAENFGVLIPQQIKKTRYKYLLSGVL